MRKLVPFASIMAVAVMLAACSTGEAPDWPQVECTSVLSGAISEDTVIEGSGADCDYRLEGNLQVGAELTISAGTNIVAEPASRITIREGGSLQVNGNRNAGVALTGRQAEHGSWEGICFFPGHGASSIRYATIEWAGAAPFGDATPACRAAIGGVGRGSATVHIGNTLVYGSATTGVDATTFRLETFSQNTLAANLEYGIRVTGDTATALGGNSDYTGESLAESHGDRALNGRPYVYLSAGPGSIAEPLQTRTWSALGGTPWHIAADGDAYPESTLVLEEMTRILLTPGTGFVMGEGSGIEIGFGAALAVFGSEGSPVLFNGETPAAGSWNGILVAGGILLARHLELNHAGVSDGAISFAGGPVTGCSDVRQSRIADSLVSAIHISERYSGFVHQTDNTFRNIPTPTVDGIAGGPPVLDDVACSSGTNGV